MPTNLRYSESSNYSVPPVYVSRLFRELPPLPSEVGKTQLGPITFFRGSCDEETRVRIQLGNISQPAGPPPPAILVRPHPTHFLPRRPPNAPVKLRKLGSCRHGGSNAGCAFCGFSQSHYLATIAYNMRIPVLAQRVGELQDVNRRDMYGNTGLHYLATTGPSLATLKVFFQAAVDLNCTNTDGETFMHHLELSRLEGSMTDLLILLGSLGFHLTHRAHNGQTVLHSLFQREFSIDVLCEILPVFQTARNNINAWDNQGYSAADMLYVNWKSLQGKGRRSSDDIADLKQILIYFGATWHPRRGTSVKMAEDEDRETSLASPKRLDEDRDSQTYRSAESYFANGREMLDTVTRSTLEPSPRTRLGQNPLHRLAHIIRLNPSSPDNPHPEWARLSNVAETISLGVDPNGFDQFGETPLHTLLSKPRSNEDELATSQIVRFLVDRGANIEMRNRDGETPLHLASKNGLLACVDALLALGANVHARNRCGRGVIAEARVMSLTCQRHGMRVKRIWRCIEMVQQGGGIEHPTESHEYCLRRL